MKKIIVLIVIVILLVISLVIPIKIETEKIWVHYGEHIEAGGYRYKVTKYNIYGMIVNEHEISDKEYYELNKQ
jgi:hypothetical protein